MRRSSIRIIAILFAAIVTTRPAVAQSAPDSQDFYACASDVSLFSLLPPSYRDWLIEDVPYLISKEERCVFLELTNDSDRDVFIRRFWERRSPDPESEDNTFEQEHYRRIAYSNDHFGGSQVGWETDRGRIYIMFGEPDQFETAAASSDTSAWATEIWRYRYLDGIGENVELEFVRSSITGDFRLNLPPGLDGTLFSTGFAELEPCNDCGKAFCLREWTDLMIGGTEETRSRFKDLEAFADLNANGGGVQFEVTVDYIPVTRFITLLPVKIEVPTLDLARQSSDFESNAGLRLFLQIEDSQGSVVERLEDTLTSENIRALAPDSTKPFALERSFPVRPGPYHMQVVVANSDSGQVGTFTSDISVPEMPTGH